MFTKHGMCGACEDALYGLSFVGVVVNRTLLNREGVELEFLL